MWVADRARDFLDVEKLFVENLLNFHIIGDCQIHTQKKMKEWFAVNYPASHWSARNSLKHLLNVKRTAKIRKRTLHTQAYTKIMQTAKVCKNTLNLLKKVHWLSFYLSFTNVRTIDSVHFSKEKKVNSFSST